MRVFAEIEDIAGQFAETAYITAAMENCILDNKYVYNKLYDLSSVLRDKAVFSIYSIDGSCLYTTGNMDEENIITELRHRHFTGRDINDQYMNNAVSIETIGEYGLYVVLVRPEIFTADVTKSMYMVLIILAILSFMLCFVISSS